MVQTDTAELTGAEGVFPASFAQQRMWFLERFESSAVYNVPVATRLRGPLDVAALELALGALIERHESLRTVFTLVDGVPHQLIKPVRLFTLDVADVSALPGAVERAVEIASEQARARFDLARDEPIRVALVKIAEDDHLLSLTLHHIATDAWSMGVLSRELAELYRGFSAGEPVELPELKIQYADYAVWQRRWMESGGLDQQLDYWLEQLAGAPPLLELPTDHPRPSRQSFRGATVRTMLPRELMDRVLALGEQEGATLFMTLLAAFGALLFRYSGQEDVVVASPVANRGRTELERVIGLFVNTVALRVDLEGDPTFRQLLGRVREAALGAFSNQELPFEKLVEKLAPERHLSHAPVAQVMFVVQNAVERSAAFPDLEEERVLTDRGTAKFDLTFFVSETPEGLRVSLEYCTDLFEETTALRMLEHYRVLLEAAAVEPGRAVSELRLLSSEDELLLSDWSAAPKTYPADRVRPIHELFASQARRTPDAVAVECAGEQLSYAGLEARANRLARYLDGLGVKPGSVVAVCAERSVEQMVAVLAVLKAGAAYAPIDPSYPAERIAFMLGETDAPLLLTQQCLAASLPAHHARTVLLDADWHDVAREDERPLEEGATLEDLAYVIYTSGSTGRPKGVAMAHRPLANLLAWQLECWSEQPPARTLQFATLSFDVAFQELFSTWCSGGTLVLVDDEVRRDAEALLEYLREQRVERLFLPFAALQNLCEAAGHSGASLPALREVITAGEQVKVTDALRGFFLEHSDCTLVNQYGPTESHVVTRHTLSSDPKAWPALPPIGRPIANARVYLLDRHRRPVPIGVPGELYIGGVSLARGYLGRPDLTAERFVVDHFSDDVDARQYRTGDLARWRPDGEIEYLGRADHQVKIRGFRVEPGEIESVLREHEAVREALVVALGDAAEKRLVAYLVADRATAAPADFREFLARRLPEYMIPAAFVPLRAFPLNPNGKIDRSALPAPDDRTRATSEYIAPRTAVERMVAEIWQRLLDVDRIGIRDDFFRLGGHSLLAVQLVSRVRDALGFELPLRTVFEAPTVADLAGAIEEVAASAPELPPIRPMPRAWQRFEHPGIAEEVCVLPASFAEQRLWFLDRLEPESGAYNLAVASRFRGRLDIAALERALNELIVRHETLRTTFSMIDDVPQRVIRRPRPVSLHVTDLGEDESAQESAPALVRSEASRGFDLESGPLLRARLLRLGENEHIFILALHHIIVDGWSMGVLNRELSVLYSACLEGRSRDLPELPIQYADYAGWQQDWIERGGLDDQLEYWRSRLADAPELLELPTDRPRPARQSFRGGVVRSVLPAPLLKRLKALGEREGTTLFMTLLSAYYVLLCRYSGQEDLVVASPVANRERTELEGVVGFFVNTLALRVNLESKPTFRELLARVRETALGAFSNQDLPFEKLVEELNPGRDLSHSPVAQVLFLLQTTVGESSLELEGLTREHVGGARLSTKFDLSLNAVESSDGLRLSFGYATDLFEEATVARMLDHLVVLLEAAAADPDVRIDRLPLLTGEERERLLVEWNSTEVAYPPATLHALVEAQVRRSPEAVAVSFDGEQLTYAELDARANRFARHLRAAGAGPDSLVAVSLERSLELIVSLLGILKAGAAYVPLDPELPRDRLAFMLDDSSADVLVTSERVLARLPPHAGRTICIDTDWPEIAVGSPEVLDVEVGPDNLAYVIYTSGSTGRPKGVLNTHGGIVNRLLSMQDTYPLGPSDRLLQKTQTSFDVSVREIFWPLLCGARIVVTAPHEQGNPSYLAALIDREQVTTLHFVPSMLRLFLEEVDPARCRSLRCVLAGGETLPAELARAFFARFDCELHNLYGPTEAAVSVTTWRCDPGFRGGIVPIGRPVANTPVYVLDSRLAPVPVGVWGEIFIGGAQLARGYHERPELTAERFIPSPFGPGRLYRTGDIGRWNNDGALEFGGRLDDQIKLRGFRIEPGEIQAVLQEHEAVDESAVITFESSSGECELAAYVVPGAAYREGKHEVPDLLSLLRAKLPDHMVPGSVTWLDALPLLPNGKLDRNALPAPDRRLASAEYMRPRTELEWTLAEIWQEVLRVDRVGVYDDFFALGGHSLLAIKLISRVHATVQVDVPLRTIFEARTLETFAAAVERAFDGDSAAPVLPPLRSLPREPRRLGDEFGGDVFVLPASYAERRLWFLDRLEPNSAAYTVPLAVRLRGMLDVGALRQALDALVARHESLRTVFTLIDGVPNRVVRPPQRVSLPVTDLSRHGDAQARALSLVREDSAQPFDLEAGPLLRAGLLRLGEDEHIFVLTLHHIVVDGWSIGVLKRELSDLYSASLEGRPANLPELSLQYGDFAAWQEEWTQSGALDGELDYWRAQLAGAPPLLELPTDRPHPTKQSFRGASLGTTLPKSLVERVKALGEQERTTPFMTLLAAFGVLLSRYSGQEDVVVASPVANRDRIELEGVIGLFVNTLALRVNLEGEPSFRQLLGRVREVSLGAYSNQHLQFEKLVEELNPERHLGRPPIAQVLFAVGDAMGQGSFELQGLESAPVPRGRQTAKFDLSMFAVERPDGLRLSFEYCTEIFNEATVVRMLDHYRVLLEGAVAEPERPVGELPLLTDREQSQLLLDWNRTERPFPADRCVHELFEDEAERRPAAIALSTNGERISYRELNERANRLAHRLRGLGVGPEDLVGICLERGIDLIVAMLATLKAGGAYVPLDPDYPLERLEFMLEDTAAPVLISETSLAPRLPSFGGALLCLDAASDEIAGEPSVNPRAGAQSDNLAYVMYTSGSTGRPKGAMIEHRAICRLVKGADYADFGLDQVFLQLAPVSFDASTFEIWGALLNGARLAIFPPEPPTIENLAATLRREGVTTLWLTAALFHHVAGEAPSTFTGLRQLLSGGDVLAVEHVRTAVEALRGGRFVNGYGPTETTTFACCHQITAATEPGESVPIGRPIANTDVYVLDRRRNPVPIGVVGELYIGGPGVARGYLNRPELTAERFVEHPFNRRPGARLYRTGDRVRYRQNGTIEFLGRFDDQVKVRGFRVEPGEVEAALIAHPSILEAAVVARRQPDGNQGLLAYFVASAPAPTTTALRGFLAERLPGYMLPAALVALEEFPRTPSGKLDRRALPEPTERPELEQSYVAPQTETEAALVEIWRDVLALDKIGIHEDFFELGGHSLTAVRLFAAIERKLDARLPLSALFEKPTIAALAEMIELARHEEIVWPSLVALRAGDNRQVPLFLVAWAGGEVLPYRDLVENLEGDVPVVGLRPPGVDRRELPLATVEELAEYYVGEIRRVQPHGPYRLGGFCFSGLVAYEMARQLRAQGETISLLALADAYPYRPFRRRGIVQAGRIHVKALRHADRVNRREWLRARIAGLRGRVHHAVYFNVGPTVFERLAARHLERLIPRRPWNLVLIASNAARKRYVPTPANVRVTLFRAQRTPEAKPTPWDELAQGVELRSIVAPGITHESMMREPHVKLFAKQLMEDLADDESDSGGSSDATTRPEVAGRIR